MRRAEMRREGLPRTNPPLNRRATEMDEMKAFLLTLALGAGFGASVAMQAQAQGISVPPAAQSPAAQSPAAQSPAAQSPAATPVTATCKDGTTFSGSKRSGACKGHGGVEAFTTTTPASTTPGAAGAPSTMASKDAGLKPSDAAKPPPGAPGQVWVNSASKVYHCPGTTYYGKTKRGEYMTEAAAKAAGDHPNHGKTCS
jgi:hypothetical protein